MLFLSIYGKDSGAFSIVILCGECTVIFNLSKKVCESIVGFYELSDGEAIAITINKATEDCELSDGKVVLVFYPQAVGDKTAR